MKKPETKTTKTAPTPKPYKSGRVHPRSVTLFHRNLTVPSDLDLEEAPDATYVYTGRALYFNERGHAEGLMDKDAHPLCCPFSCLPGERHPLSRRLLMHEDYAELYRHWLMVQAADPTMKPHFLALRGKAIIGQSHLMNSVLAGVVTLFLQDYLGEDLPKEATPRQKARKGR